MKTLRLRFSNDEGMELSARLELPPGNRPIAYALLAHCFTCGKNLSAIGNISRALTQQRIAVLRFDFTGIGESEGDFADTNFSSRVGDLVSAARYLKEHYEAPQIIIGHSLGGAASIVAAPQIPSVRAVVTIGAPAEASHVRRLLHDSLDHIRATGSARVSIGGRLFTITEQFLDDLEQDRVLGVVRTLDRAVLIMHSPQDNVVGIENASALYEAARHPKSFITLDDADHLLLRPADSLYAGSMIAAWARHYLPAPEQPAIRSDERVVTRTGEERYTTEVRTGRHSFLADEPESAGGADLGPTPYDLLTAALGACTGMTLRMYADRKGWDLDEVRVHLSHRKDYAEDCGVCDKEKAMLDHIDRRIELDGALDDEQRQKLLDIANKCPVHRTLHSEIRIRTSLMEPRPDNDERDEEE